MMKAIWFRSFVVLAMLSVVGACTSTSTTESAGQYVDDSVITTKVKAAVLAEPGLSTLQIGVETYKQVVQLSGFVDSGAAKTRAGAVAGNVEGVKSVRNNLVVK